MGTSIDQLESRNLTTGSTARTDLISGVIEVVVCLALVWKLAD